MSLISVWTVCGPSIQLAFNNRRTAEAANPPEKYSGPMDDQSYGILNTALDLEGVQPLYNTKSVQGSNPFALYPMNFPDEQSAIDAMDYLDAAWPGKIEIQGAWSVDTGLPMGVTYTFDENGDITGTTGVPVYELNATTFELIPDFVISDIDGNDIVRIPVVDNSDLRDVNLVWGQQPRQFGIV